MFYIVLTMHLVLCVTLIGLVLLQQGKGADMGAAFGGGSNTLFGATGATAFITKFTTGIAIAFMVTSVLLVNLYSTHSKSSVGGVVAGPDAIKQQLDRVQPPAGAAEAPAQAASAQVPPVAPPASAAK